MAEQGGSSGPATDKRNEPVIDPTKNVLDLVEAAIARQDDLRKASTDHLKEVADLRDRHYMELAKKETERLNAIRAVDVGAAQILAAQVATSAETLRNQVAAAAQASVVSLGAALEPIIKDVAELRKVQYEQAGQKASIVESKDDRRGGVNTAVAVASVVLAVLALIATVVIAVVLGS